MVNTSHLSKLVTTMSQNLLDKPNENQAQYKLELYQFDLEP